MNVPNLLSGFERYAQKNPSDLAFEVGERCLTYGEVAARVKPVAAWIARLGDPAQQRVGIVSGRSVGGFLAVLGALWAGAMYVPLNTKMPRARLVAMAEKADLTALLVDSSGADFLRAFPSSGNVPALLMDDLDTPHLGADLESMLPSTPRPAATLLSDQYVYLMFTSGTTGEPKGIAASVENLRHYLTFMQQRHRILPGDRMSQLFELSFDASVYDILMSLNHGASFHVVPDSLLLAPANFIRDKRLNRWFGVPSNIAFMKKARVLKADAFPELRFAFFGGEPFPADLVRSWRTAAPNAQIDNVYGPTETTVTCFVQDCGDPLAVTKERDVVAIGRPYTGMLGAVLDESGRFLPDGESGELLIAGPQVTAGYWRDEALTAQRFVELDHPEYARQRWYRTGDLGYRDATGVYHHLGRMDNQIKVSGHRVELEDVEAHLRTAARSSEVAAVPWPVEQGTARGIVGFVCANSPEPNEIRTAMRAALPLYMVPSRVICLAEMPYTLNGKVDRKKLVAMLDSQTI